MKRLLTRAVPAVVLAATTMAVSVAAGQTKRPDPKTVLTRQLVDLTRKLAATRDAAARRDLREQIEWTRHRLGPTDTTGRRIACQALWHDAALRDAEARLKRFRQATGTGPRDDPTARLRRALWRAIAAALAQGWGHPGTVERYRLDALGTYLYNNHAVVEDLLDRAVGHLAQAGRTVAPPPDPADPGQGEGATASGTTPSEAADTPSGAGGGREEVGGPAPPGYFSGEDETPGTDAPADTDPGAASEAAEPSDPRGQALALIQDGLAAVIRAGDRLDGGADGGRQGAACRTLADALVDVYRATAALEAPGPDGAVTLPSEAADAGPTAAQEAALDRTADLIAGIEAPPWQAIRAKLERLRAIAEQGVARRKTRRDAARLLHVVVRTAEYIHGLLASKAASAGYVADRRESIAEALEDIEKPEDRDRQYRRLLRLADGDPLRRALDASGLSRPACLGLMGLTGLSRSRFPKGEKGYARYRRFRDGLERLIRALGRARTGPPEAMGDPFRSLYVQTTEALRRQAAALGEDPPEAVDLLRQKVAEAAALAADLWRLVRADRVVRAARDLLPRRSGPLSEEVQRRVERFVLDPSAKADGQRSAFDEFIEPLDRLRHVRLPAKEHTPLANRLSGGAYRAALAHFGQKLTRNMASVAQGTTEYLESTLHASVMFRLLRHRAVAEQTGLSEVGTACLAPFSLPPKPWQAFVAALDKRLAGLLRQYGTLRGWSPSAAGALWRWDRIYCTVTAARHRTRPAGGGDLERLIAAVEHTADPEVPEDVWMAWATGYHTLEAAVCLVAGYPATAGEHLDHLDRLRRKHGAADRLGADTFDPR